MYWLTDGVAVASIIGAAVLFRVNVYGGCMLREIGTGYDTKLYVLSKRVVVELNAKGSLCSSTSSTAKVEVSYLLNPNMSSSQNPKKSQSSSFARN